MNIRSYRKEDADIIASLLRQSVTDLAYVFYTQEQVKVWVKTLPNSEKVRLLNKDGRETFVIEDGNNNIQAFIDLENSGHIDYLYASASVAGTGVASKLYDYLEMQALRKGMERLYTEASEHARRFFSKKGFVEIQRKDFEINGVQIYNYSMEKHI